MLHELGELYPLISSLIVVVALTLRLKTRAIGIKINHPKAIPASVHISSVTSRL